MQDVGQELTFKAEVYDGTNANVYQTTKLALSHLEIKDPANNVLYDTQLDGTTTIAFKPKTLWTYAATFRNRG